MNKPTVEKLSPEQPTKVIAGSLGLTAFAIAVVAGLFAGNESTEILIRALISMLLCYVLGLVLGAIGERTIEEHIRDYIAARPVKRFSEPIMEVGEVGEEPTLITGGKQEEMVSAG